MKLGYQESNSALEVRILAHQRYAAVKLEDKLEAYLTGHTQSRILDVGCGSGNFTDLFSHHAALYVGMDANAELLRAAQAKAERLAIRKALWICRSMDDPFPFVDASFDVVFFVYSAYYTQDVEALLKQVRSVLAKNGKAYFVGPVAGNAKELDAICHTLFHVTSTSEKDARVDRLEKEFVPAATRLFPKTELNQFDLSLQFPSNTEYLRYVRATPQYLELIKAHGDKPDSDLLHAIEQTGGLTLTKKALILGAAGE